jgi:HK97 family phage portal protein
MRSARRIARAEAARSEKLLEIITDAQNRRAGVCGISPWELPTVVACRRLIADTVAQLPLTAMRNGVPRPDQPTLYLRPNPAEPYWLTMHRTVNNLTGRGHVWIVPTAWDAADWPLAARVVDADHATATFTANGRELAEIWIDGQRLEPGPGGAVWVPYDVPAAGSLGVSPIAGCWRAAEYLAALYDMAGSFWEAGFPSVAIQIAQRLGPDDAPKLKAQVIQAWSRRHEPAVMDNGAQIVPVGSSPVEAELVASIDTANKEIARAFGVMPSLVNVPGGDSLTYSTTEGEYSKWKSVGLGPYLMRIEGGYTDLTVYGTTARFDTAELTRTDAAARAAYYTAALAGGWLTVNEVRRMEGAGPLPGPADNAPPAVNAPTALMPGGVAV